MNMFRLHMPFAELFNDVRPFMKIVRGQKFMMFHSNAGLVKGYCKGRKGLGMLSTILCGDDKSKLFTVSCYNCHTMATHLTHQTLGFLHSGSL